MRFLRRLGLFFVLLIVFILGGLTVLLNVFEDEIGAQVVKTINASLKSELSIEELDLSVLRSFPNAAINLRGVKLQDAGNAPLLEAGNLSLRFGLFSLLGSNIKVKSVLVENGVIAIRYDRRGNPNYAIFKEDESTEDIATEGGGSDVGISLEEARLRDLRLIYEDQAAKQGADVLVKDAVFAGEFSSTAFALSSEAQLETAFVEQEGERFLEYKSLDYDAVIAINLEEGTYDLERVIVGVDGNEFSLDGNIVMTDDYTDLDLTAKNEGGKLDGIVALLPASYLEGLGGFESRGQFDFDAVITGRSSQTQSPDIRANFSLEDGRISSDLLNNPFKDVSLKAVYASGKQSSFVLERLKGYFDNELLELQLSAKDLENPLIDFSMDGTLPLRALYRLADSPNISDGSGEIEIKDLRLKGRYSDMQSMRRIDRVQASGVLEFDDAALTINDDKILIDRGGFALEDNQLIVQDIKVEGAGSDFLLSGQFRNILPVLFADSLNSKSAELAFNAKLKARALDFDRLIGLTTSPVEEGDVSEAVYDSLQTAEIQQREAFTNFLDGRFDAEVLDFNYERIEGKNFLGKVEFENNEMRINGKTNAMEGTFDLSGVMHFEDEPYLNVKLICENLNGEQFFYQTESFGQDFLTDKNIRGTMDSKIAIYAYWDEQMNFDYDKLTVLAEVDIDDGELIQFELFKYFSSLIKLQDLEHVKFNKLVNWFEISRQRIYIPAMFIQSNALNLTLNGTYDLDYDFDMYFKINAEQVLANRMRRYNPTMLPLPARRDGWFNVYAHIFGDVDEYDYKLLANRDVKLSIERSKRLRNSIREKLEQEFGAVAPLYEPQEWLDIPEYGDPEDEKIEYLDNLFGEEGIEGGSGGGML